MLVFERFVSSKFYKFVKKLVDVFPVIGLIAAFASSTVIVKKAIEEPENAEQSTLGARELAGASAEPDARDVLHNPYRGGGRIPKNLPVPLSKAAPPIDTTVAPPNAAPEAFSIGGPAEKIVPAQRHDSSYRQPALSPFTQPPASLKSSAAGTYDPAKGIESLLTNIGGALSGSTTATTSSTGDSTGNSSSTDTDSTTTTTPGIDVSDTLSTIVGTGPVTANGVATSTITITLKSSSNAAVPGIAPTFSATNTGTTNSYGGCSITNAVGVSTCTLSSTVAEVKTLTLTSPITMTGGTVTFQAGAAAKLAFTTQPSATAVSGTNFGTMPVVKVQDANGNTVTGAVDAITLSASTTATTCATAATGTIAATTNPLNAVAGVATFAAVKYNSASGTIYVKAEAAGLTQACSSAVVVSNTAPVITSTHANRLFPLDGTDEPIVPGSTYTFTATATDADGHSVSYGCTFVVENLSTSDPSYVNTATDCRNLASLATISGAIQPSLLSFDTTTGVFTWIPTISQRGTYKFTITASDAHGGSDTESFQVTVREPYSSNNLRQALDAQFSRDLVTPVVPGRPAIDAAALDTTAAWLDLSGSSRNASFSGGYTAAPWLGTGAGSSPYQLACSGAAEYLDLGAASLGGQTKAMVSGWFKPTSPLATGKILVTSGGGTGNGLAITQSSADAGKLQLYLGRKTYSDVVLSDQPVGYWRLGDTAGVTAVDSSTTANNGTYVGTYVLNQPSGLTDDSDGAVSFTAAKVTIPDHAKLKISEALSISFWIYPRATVIGYADHFVAKWGAGGVTANANYVLYYFGTTSGLNGNICLLADAAGVWGGISGCVIPPLNQWSYITFTYDTSAAKSRVYLNGSMTSEIATVGALRTDNRDVELNDISAYDGLLDEVAIFNYALSPIQVKNHYEAGKNQFSTVTTSTQAGGPRLYWRLNETSGTTAYDTATGPTGIDGTYTGGVALGNRQEFGPFRAAAAYFDGTDDFVALASRSLFPTTGMTGMAWIKTTSTDNAAAYPGNAALNVLGDHTNQCVVGFGVHAGKVRYNHWSPVAWASFDSATSVNTGVWTHIAFTHDQTTGAVKIYVNGIEDANGNKTYHGAAAGLDRIGGGYLDAVGTGDLFKGLLADVAVFSRPLSAAEILAIYQGSKLSHCQSGNTFASGLWSYVTALWDGTKATLLIDGHEECTVTPGTTFTPSTNLTVAASATGSNSWDGSVADLKVYGTSNGSAAGTATLAGLNYQATSNRFRTIPLPDISTASLILHLDPANAKGGTSPYAAGCGASDITYADLSPSGNAGTLKNFAGCVTNGWRGTGTTSDPYRLAFDGANDYVFVGHGPLDHTKATQRTYSAWIKTTTTGSVITQNSASTVVHNGLWFFVNSAGAEPYFTMFTTTADPIGGLSGTATLQDGIWHNFVGTYDGSDTGAGVKIYVDGVEHAKTFTFNTGGGTYAASDYPFEIGAANGAQHPFTGDMGPIMIYSDDLTAAQVLQNYKAYRPSYPPVINMSGLQVWLAADSGVTYNASNEVSQWNDLSGNANHALQGTAANKPLFTYKGIGGKPTIRFDGTNDVLALTNTLNLSTGGSVFIVARNAVQKNWNGMIRIAPVEATTPGEFYLYWQMGSNNSVSGNLVHLARINGAGQSSGRRANDVGPAVGLPFILTDILTNNASISMYLNGSILGGLTNEDSGGITDLMPAGANNAWIGVGYPGSYLNGDISEVIVFNRAVTANERQLIHDYLSAKYGISIP